MDFSGYKYIAEGLVLLEILMILLNFRRRPRLAMFAALVSVALRGQYIWIGRALYAWQFASLVGLAILVVPPAQGRAGRSFAQALGLYRTSFQVFFAYSFVVSLVMWWLFWVEGAGTAQTGVSASRIATQVVYELMLIGFIGFGAYAGRSTTTWQVVRAIVWIATLAAYFAIIQVAVHTATHVNLFPIIGSNDTIRSAYYGGLTFRATSFVGEPKHLGILMSLGLSVFVLARGFRVNLGRFAWHKPLVMAVALLLSLSTTGMVLSAVGVGFLAVILWPRMRQIDMLVLAATVAIGGYQLSTLQGHFASALDAQSSKLHFEVQDQSVADALTHDPVLAVVGTGLGNIHLIAAQYLPADFPLFRASGYKANSGLFYELGDVGLIGLLLLVIGPLFGVNFYMRHRSGLSREQRSEAFAALSLVLVIMIGFLLRYSELYFLMAGFVYERLVQFRRQAVSSIRRQGWGTGDARPEARTASLSSLPVEGGR